MQANLDKGETLRESDKSLRVGACTEWNKSLSHSVVLKQKTTTFRQRSSPKRLSPVLNI